tara:strand:- start:228 stop:500 length:273 start_codon:yes stop_codon:yes gene_type:complete
MENSKEFNQAVKIVEKLKTKPSNEELGNLYKYYKQATVGDVNKDKPNFIYFKEAAKWDAWNSVKGLSKHNCEVEYIKLVNNFIKTYGLNK